MLASLALLSLVSTASAKEDYEFGLDGYYRARMHVYGGFYPEEEGSDTDAEAGKFATQRLRLQPTLNFENRAKFIMMADVLDDVVWGDNQSLASTSVFAGDPSSTGVTGEREDVFQIKRAWTEFNVAVGTFRVGRQESNWGMGLLSNHGNGFDDTFGENHFGSTFDRLIFATKPVSVARTLMGKKKTDSPLIMAVGVDRLVEDPLFQYYGYPCTPSLFPGDPGYNAACDTDGDTVTDIEHDYVDDTRTEDQRPSDWAFDNSDDVFEMVYVLLYKNEGFQLGGRKTDLTAGLYTVTRKQEETNSNILIMDAYGKFERRGLYLEGEVLNIRGQTDGIALRGSYDPSGTVENPLHKEANIWGWVARAGYQRESATLMMEAGHASGDENVADASFTGRPLHPDHNVGLLLYEEVLAEVTARTWSKDAEGLWSNGGVYNSTYIFPNVRYRTLGWEFIGAYLLAWPHKPDGSRILCAPDDGVECSDPKNGLAKELGYEIDLAAKYKFHKHMLFSTEAGWAQISNRVPLENIGLDPDGKFWTVQTRIAYEF
jgi:hypothetical protein